MRESLVLLKNEGGILPINPDQNILITGSGADSMQQQTGGWTLNWQGTGNANDEFLTGETILSGIQAGMSGGGGSVTLSADGSFENRPDVAVVVYGEQPYAEYRGDRSDLVFEFADGENHQLIQSFKDQDIPVVSVFLTGRPMWVNPLLNASDAFVVAWLPGTEGGGVGDVLVAGADGNPRHDFKGRLSFTWPSDGTGNPIDSADDPGVLFPYGHGLTYADAGDLDLLSEDPGIPDIATSFDGKIITRGDAANAFSLVLGDSSNLNTPVQDLVGSSLGGGIATRGTDYKAQEDSRVYTWSGNGRARVAIKSLRPVDLTVFGDPDKTTLSLTWRIDTPPSDALLLGMGCGDGCLGQIDIENLTQSLPEDEWATTDIPVSCLVDAGLDPTNVDTALMLTGPSEAEITVHAAELKLSEHASGQCPG